MSTWNYSSWRRFNSRAVFVLIGLTLLVVIGVIYFWRHNASASKTYDSQPISFSYQKQYQQQPLAGSAGNGSRLMLRLNAQNPVRTITLTYEKGAKTGATLTKQNFLDFLESNASTNLPGIYKNYGYAKDKIERRQVSGQGVSAVSFNYTGKDKTTRVYSTLLIIPVDKDGYYLKLESTDKKSLDSEANKLISSLKISR